MHTLTLTAIGNSTGVIIPKEVLDRLKLEKGTKLFLSETKEGLHLTPYDAELEEDMKAVRDVTIRYRNALRELAK